MSHNSEAICTFRSLITIESKKLSYAMAYLKSHKIGVLAFGSLINDPGYEIKAIEKERISCKTPFKVEYARISDSRSGAPTLIPVDDSKKGDFVSAEIIVLNNTTELQTAKDILYRREIHTWDLTKKYVERKNPTSKNVLIVELDNFEGVEKVIYTSFLPQEKYADLTPEKLADFAINSYKTDKRLTKKDGINYLLDTKQSGIITELSKEYEDAILKKIGADSLEDAMSKLDVQTK